MFPRLPVSQFGPLALCEMRERMIQGTHRPGAKRAKPLARPTINARIHRIRRIFRWGVSRQLVPPSLLHGLQSVESLKCGHTTAREPEPVKPVSWDDIQATLPQLPAPIGDMVLVQYYCGCRPGELCKMRMKDLDRTGKVWVYTPASHKTAHRGLKRVIWIGPKCQDLLQKHLKADPEAFLFSPSRAAEERNANRRKKRKTPMTPSQRARKRKRNPDWKPGACYTPVTYAQAITRACKLAGVEHWHPHRLRHSRATVLRRDYGVDAARTILGHSSLDATQIYAEADHNRAVTIVSQAG
jgi:integrase